MCIPHFFGVRSLCTSQWKTWSEGVKQWANVICTLTALAIFLIKMDASTYSRQILLLSPACIKWKQNCPVHWIMLPRNEMWWLFYIKGRPSSGMNYPALWVQSFHFQVKLTTHILSAIFHTQAAHQRTVQKQRFSQYITHELFSSYGSQSKCRRTLMRVTHIIAWTPYNLIQCFCCSLAYMVLPNDHIVLVMWGLLYHLPCRSNWPHKEHCM